MNSGPPALAAQNKTTFNIPQVSVKLCRPSTTTCATITNVLVDTGSTGLRIFASVLSSAGLSLPLMTDPLNSNNTIGECVPFVDGYTWGPLTTATVQLGGEIASSISVNIMDDNSSYPPAVPQACTTLTSGTSLNSPAKFSANGILGVAQFIQDCGSGCATDVSNDVYYSCNSTSGSCNSTAVVESMQVTNPVSAFALDNNGVILQLPAISNSGAVSATGTLTFGIATQSNNTLGSAFILQADDQGFFTATYNGTAFNSSFIDSGSNAYFFASSITACDSHASGFYCPTNPVTIPVSNQGHDSSGSNIGGVSSVSFVVNNVEHINTSYFALPAVGGAAASSSGTNMLANDFDFGLPFFYGRKIFVGIQGLAGGAGGPVGPYYAY